MKLLMNYTKETFRSIINEMHGIQRLPMLYNQDVFPLLDNYEVLGCEPLHDVTNHIDNLYMELPHHLNKSEKKMMEEIIFLSFERKDTKRGIDYRKSLLKLTIYLKGKINNDVYRILLTMCEIQHPFADETKRTVENILRLQNQIFIHTCLLKCVVGKNLKVLTCRCFYGKYFHALMCHTSVIYRIISGKAVNTEQEERFFNSLKTITNSTSNYHPDHIILNNLIRLQEGEEVCKGEGRMQHEVRKLSDGLPSKHDSMIPFWMIDMFEWEWQTHLEKISDYILEGCWWKETSDGVMFHDVNMNLKTKKQVHHFRSSNIEIELTELKVSWGKCLEMDCIPARRVKNLQEDILHFTSLNFFNNTIKTEESGHMNEKQKLLQTTQTHVSKYDLGNQTAKKDHNIDFNITDVKLFISEGEQTYEPKNISEKKSITDKSNIISLKPLIKPILKDTKSVFMTKTAHYIHEIIPEEKELINKYDNARTKSKQNHCDKTLYNILCDISAQLEIKLLIKFEKLEMQLTTLKMKQVSVYNKLTVVPEEESERKEYENINNKLKILRALRHQMKF